MAMEPKSTSTINSAWPQAVAKLHGTDLRNNAEKKAAGGWGTEPTVRMPGGYPDTPNQGISYICCGLFRGLNHVSMGQWLGSLTFADIFRRFQKEDAADVLLTAP